VTAFENGFQRAILRLAMIDEAFANKVMTLVDPSFFTTEACGWVFTTMQRYYGAYSMRCTEIPLRDSLRYAPPDKVAAYSAEIDALVACGSVPERDYIKSELKEFCRRNVFALAHKESAALYNESKHDAAYDVMRKAQEQIERVTFDDEDRQWFSEEFDQRQKVRYKKSLALEAHAFSTGVQELDEATDGGIQPGEVWLVLAYAKIGKTTWICNQLFNAIRMHKQPALHIQLEGMGEQTAVKYDTLFSNELYVNVRRGEFNTRLLRELQAEYARLRGLLVIRTLNDWDVSILNVDAEINYLRAQGFDPKIMGLDYLDLLRSRHRRDSETQHQVDAARDTKLLAVRRRIAVHTASQAQRPKDTADEYEHILKAANIADAYAKIRIVDFVGSLNATREEREKGEMRLFAEMHRDNPMGRLYTLHNDLSRMKMAKTSEVKRMRSARSLEDPPGTASATSTASAHKRGGRGAKSATA
jgi:replicative DNA helicase